MQNEVYIIDARRSPIGRFGGGLKDVSAAELARQVAEPMLREDLAANVEQVILGQVLQAATGMNTARQVALSLKMPQATTAFTVNMVCGSGLKAVALAAAEISTGSAGLILAGGTENMSRAPHYAMGVRFGTKLGDSPLVDSIMADGLTDPSLKIGMGETAENIARANGITREEQDAFAVESQQKWVRAKDAWPREIVSIQPGRGAVVEHDEHPRADTSLEKLAQLRPAFRTDGSVTAGNSSGINDGAALVLLAGKDACARHNLRPRARISGFAATGCDPALMGLGPVSAVHKLYKQIGWDPASVDAIEINEAFAVQTLACARELDISPEKLNWRGGAIALGHPIGASGARVLVTLLHMMEDENLQRGIATLCVGGGMGVAMAIERVGEVGAISFDPIP